ncbi:MAG: glycosyltransferase [Mycoplasma sp.]
MNKKILIITSNPHFCIGGMETYNYNLIKLLIKNGYVVDEYSINMNSVINNVRDELKVKQLNPINEDNENKYISERLFKSPRIKEIEKLSEDYDFVINSGINLIWPKSIYKSNKWIYIQHFNISYFEHKYILGSFFQPIFKLIALLLNKKNPLKSFRNVVLYSKSDIEELSPKKNQNIIDINLSILSKKTILSNLNKWTKNKNKRQNFIYVGRINKKQKSILKIINIFDKVMLKIDFFGSGEKEIMKNTSFCNFKGHISNKDIEGTITKYKYAVLLSKYEGFSYFLVEALSNGVPIITTNCSASSKMLSDKKGFLVNYRNAAKIISEANNIEECEYNKMVEESFRFSIENLSLEVFEEKWIEFLKTINLK